MSIGHDLPAPGPRHHQPGRPFQPMPPYPYVAAKVPGATYVAPFQPAPSFARQYWYPYGQDTYRPMGYQQQPAYHTPPMQTPATFYSAPQPAYPFFAPAPPPPRIMLPSHHHLTASSNPAVSALRATASEPKSIAEAYMDDPSSEVFRDLKLIPDSASAIAPHPSIDDSAVPFAAMGADYAWQLVQEALVKGATGSSPPMTKAAFAFGTIGSERKQAKAPLQTSLAQYSLSGGQGQALIGPLTPPPSSTMSNACPIPTHWQTDKLVNMQELPPWAEGYWEANRSPETSPISASYSRKPDAYTAYVHFTENLLNVTLITPQTLFLALRFVSAVCKGDPAGIYKRYSARSAPYKLLVGALVMANKVLDDNSYKSVTWSQVSAVPVKDVVDCEAFVFEKLGFDVSVSSQVWREHIVHLARRYSGTELLEHHLLRRLSTFVRGL